MPHTVAEMIASMKRVGVPSDLILSAVEDMAREADEARKAKAREKKRLQRVQVQSVPNVPGTEGTNGDNGDTPFPPCSPLSFPSDSPNSPPYNPPKPHANEPKKTGLVLVETVPKLEGHPLPFTSDAFRAALKSWVKHRKEKRASLTPSTVEKQFAKFVRWGESVAIASINQSIEAGYTGLFEVKEDQKDSGDAWGQPC